MAKIEEEANYLYVEQDMGDHILLQVYDKLPDIIETRAKRHEWTTRINSQPAAPVGIRLELGAAATSIQLLIKHYHLINKPYIVTKTGSIILMK